MFVTVWLFIFVVYMPCVLPIIRAPVNHAPAPLASVMPCIMALYYILSYVIKYILCDINNRGGQRSY